MSKKRKKIKPTRESVQSSFSAKIKVIGVGGGGGNAVSRMNRDFIRGVEFIAINTDHQDLDHCEVRKKIYIGKNLTKGLGTGMNPELGRQAGEENRAEIAEAVKDADIVFIAAGFGGGTGTGVSPVVAEAAKQAGALTIAFITKPFVFEGSQRQRIAEEGLVKIKDKVDALIVVPNERIFTVINKETPILKAFEVIDEVLKNALQGIVEMIVTPGIINVDFADVKTIIQDAGSAIVGVGLASGQERAVQAVNQALNSPLLESNPEGAKGVLLGISGGRDLRMTEINEAAKVIAQTVDPGARIIFGAYHDRRLKPNQIKITLVATGFNGSQQGANSLFSGATSFFPSEPRQAFKTYQPKNEELLRPFNLKEKEKANVQEESNSSKQPSLVGADLPLDSKQDKTKKKTDSDVWDIPTFLRRKKR